jgi:hypothetical protein
MSTGPLPIACTSPCNLGFSSRLISAQSSPRYAKKIEVRHARACPSKPSLRTQTACSSIAVARPTVPASLHRQLTGPLVTRRHSQPTWADDLHPRQNRTDPLARCKYQAVVTPVSVLATGRYLARMATIAAASALDTGGNGDTYEVLLRRSCALLTAASSPVESCRS